MANFRTKITQSNIRLNYNGEEEIEWNKTRYQVIRTIEPKNKFDIVLVCSKKIGVNNGGFYS